MSPSGPRFAARMASLQVSSTSSRGRDGVPQAESELSKPLPEGSNFRPIATQFHTAPATTVILAGVVEPKDTFGIFTLTDCWVVGRSEEVGGMARYGDQ